MTELAEVQEQYTGFKVKLDKFEGPFDLLLHLVEEKKIEIYDISISEITAAYLAYLKQLQEMDLDIASEFLLMAAILIEMKSRLLLPAGTAVDSEAMLEAEAERRALLSKLIEYKSFKVLAEKLGDREEIFSYMFTREHINRHYIQNNFHVQQNLVFRNASMADLTKAFQKAWQDFELRVLTREINHVSPMLFSVKDKIYELVEKIRLGHSRIMFSELFLQVSSKFEIIATFLALLELIKQQLIYVLQSDLFDDIEIIARKDLSKEELDSIVAGTDEYNLAKPLEELDEELEKKENAEDHGNNPEDLAGVQEPAGEIDQAVAERT